MLCSLPPLLGWAEQEARNAAGTRTASIRAPELFGDPVEHRGASSGRQEYRKRSSATFTIKEGRLKHVALLTAAGLFLNVFSVSFCFSLKWEWSSEKSISSGFQVESIQFGQLCYQIMFFYCCRRQPLFFVRKHLLWLSPEI